MRFYDVTSWSYVNLDDPYRDYAVDAGNSHMRFYDVTSWSYVNLDDPILKAIRAGVGWVWLASLATHMALNRMHSET